MYVIHRIGQRQSHCRAGKVRFSYGRCNCFVSGFSLRLRTNIRCTWALVRLRDVDLVWQGKWREREGGREGGTPTQCVLGGVQNQSCTQLTPPGANIRENNKPANLERSTKRFITSLPHNLIFVGIDRSRRTTLNHQRFLYCSKHSANTNTSLQTFWSQLSTKKRSVYNWDWR